MDNDNSKNICINAAKPERIICEQKGVGETFCGNCFICMARMRKQAKQFEKE